MERRRFPRPAGELPVPIGPVERLAHLIGREAALTLAEQRGGTALYIPQPPIREDHQLAQLIGLDAARKLVDGIETNARDMLKIPIARRWRVAVYREAGQSYAGIALLLGIDETMVHRHLQAMELTTQLSLFE